MSTEPMPRWNKALWLALGSLIGAGCLLVWAAVLYHRDETEYIGGPAPLPPPGLSVRMLFSPAVNWRRYELELTANVSPTNSVDMPKYQPPPCDLEVVFKQGKMIERTERLRLHQTGTAEWAQVATFGTDVFEFPPGDRDLVVTNLGCDRGYQFIGGVLQMRRVSPVMFSASIWPLLGGVALGILGLLSTLAGLFGLHRSRQSKF